jgi:NAD(P) transhydrogenase subunit alpha
MDILSSMATVAGYKAVILASDKLPRMFPMMMTAAGTIAPARVFVIGAGVAGLQAIASAKKAGAKVLAYDIRPAVKEQIESLGGKFLEMDLGTEDAEDKGGYAKEQSEETIQKQRQMMKDAIADSDVVITTAAIPGRKAPILVTRDMVEGMVTGSVVVDLAAERGGNVEGTEAGKTVVINGVSILGPENLPSDVPYHASQMYAKNVVTFLQNMLNKENQLDMNLEDEIINDTLVCKDGEVVNTRMREMMGLATPATEGSDA